MERINSAGTGEYVGDSANYSAEAKPLAFLMKEIIGELNREKYFCELLNNA